MQWKKSTYSAGYSGCVEVGTDGKVVGVRDSKDPGGPALAFSSRAWQAFLLTLRTDCGPQRTC